MTPHEAKLFLDSFINYEHSLHKLSNRTVQLERIRNLLEAIGQPQEKLKIIHVAGSKGKGSTSVMIAHILEKSGYRVGLYTSPHIKCLNERIRCLNGKRNEDPSEIFNDTITDEQLADILGEIKESIEGVRQNETYGRLTFYEVLTAMAFYYFNKIKTDFVVLETGLGGRLDATNVSKALIAVITPLSLEHVHILGDTLAKIAAEKAAIIKHKQDVVIAPQKQEALAVIRKVCQSFDIEPVEMDQSDQFTVVDTNLKCQKINLSTKYGDYPQLEISLLGDHQIINAWAAISVIECLERKGYAIPANAIHEGLTAVVWPLRFEIIQNKPVIILDAAHNEASLFMLTETIKTYFPDKKVNLLIGFSVDKNIQESCLAINSVTKRVWLTQAQHPRAYEFKQDDAIALFSDIPVTKTESIREALNGMRKELTEDDVLLITGSIFVASEARSILSEKKMVGFLSE